MNDQQKLTLKQFFALCFLFCLSALPHLKAQCIIDGVTLETTTCNNVNEFDVILNFEWAGGTDSFYVVGNGNDYGTFAKNDLPVTLDSPSFVGDGTTTYEFFIIDLGLPADCSTIAFLAPVSCGPSNDCGIDNLSYATTPCDADGNFMITLDFEWEFTSQTFMVVGNGVNYGTFPYSAVPVTIGPLPGNGTAYEFGVIDSEYPNCLDWIETEAILCPPFSDCEITNLVIEAIECGPGNNTQTLNIDFDYTDAPNDFFDVLDADGNILTTFPLSDLPVIWAYTYQNNNNFEALQVCINDTPGCCAFDEFELLDCPGDCFIQVPQLTFSDCDDIDHFYVNVDFEYNSNSDSFNLLLLPVFDIPQTFAYSDLPLQLGPFSNVTIQTFVVAATDQEQTDCASEEAIYTYFCNNDCTITDFVVETGDCTPGGAYTVSVFFEVENVSNAFFELQIDQESIGFYPINALPVSVQYGPTNGGGLVQVCINDNSDCCAFMQYENPCNSNNCEIWDMVAEATVCDDLGQFDAVIDFNYNNNTSDSFTIVGNGQNYGTFAYSDLPITIADLDANGALYEFIINDQEQTDCGGEVGLQADFCPDGCNVYDVVVETGDCNNDGTYLITLDFEVQNPPSGQFYLLNNIGVLIGTYDLSELPLTLTDFVGTGNDYDFLMVCIEQSANCCEPVEFEAPNCNGNDCEITDLIVEAYDCDADGNFMVDLDFNVNNPMSDSFHVLVSTPSLTALYTFAYEDLFVSFGPFTGDGTIYNILVFDIASPNCSAFFTLESEDCQDPVDCDISDLDVYPLDCNPDGSYSVLVLFDYENVGSDFFDAYAGGNYIGSYAYDDLPLTIPSFPASGNANDVLTICNSGSDMCCEVAEFQALDCGACEIAAVLLDAGTCDDQDNFFITLELQVNGEGSLGFMVLGNGTNYGTFDYDELPIELGPFAGDGMTEYEFIVVDLANTGCVGYATIGPIDCMIPNPIWPGDVNLDFISNHYDLLNIGIAYGETGAARDQTNIDWMSFSGLDWSGAFANGVNWKHADCNGDGEVNNNDITAIEQNYNAVHGDVLPFEPTDFIPGSPLFYIDLPTFDEIEMGEAFVAPIILGDLDTPVDEIYGIAFTIEYDPAMMDEAGVYVETGSSWLGEQGSQLINIDKSFANEGIIEVAITRTDHNNTSGFGTISYFIGIIDDLAGKTELTVNITNVVALTYEETRLSLDTPPSVISFTSGVGELLDEFVTVFPNPAQETLNIKLDGELQAEQLRIYNALGQLVYQVNQPTKFERVDLSNWKTGVYFMDIQFENGHVSRKVEVIK